MSLNDRMNKYNADADNLLSNLLGMSGGYQSGGAGEVDVDMSELAPHSQLDHVRDSAGDGFKQPMNLPYDDNTTLADIVRIACAELACGDPNNFRIEGFPSDKHNEKAAVALSGINNIKIVPVTVPRDNGSSSQKPVDQTELKLQIAEHLRHVHDLLHKLHEANE